MALLILPRGLRAAAQCAVAVSCSTGLAETTHAQTAAGPLEYRVKAAYLLNFARYVQWPSSAFTAPDAPLTVCVFGGDPFGRLLEETFATRRIGGRSLRVVRPTQVGAELCHVAFLGEAPAATREAWLLALQQDPTLTVGESSDFARAGGMVGFVLVNETIRFEINLDAVETARLQLSSRVLALATRLYPDRGGR